MATYDVLIQQVDPDHTDLEFAGSQDADHIETLEDRLEVKLPPSYREFIREYGAGGVMPADVSGIAGIWDGSPLLREGGSVFGDTLRVREDYAIDDTLIIIRFDAQERFCWALDTKKRDDRDECPVVYIDLDNSATPKAMANNFDMFFREYLAGLRD